jgi:hypothetical protein
MTSPYSFAISIEQFIQKTGLRADLVFRRIGLEMYNGCLHYSPVDIGRFRGSWRIGVNSVVASALPIGQGSYGVRYQDPPSPGESVYGMQALLQARFGQTIYITNNLPYAKRLEEGWSQQNTHGIIGQAFPEVVRKFDVIVQQVKAA